MPCPFRGLAYGEQLARKRERVAAALRAHPPLSGLAIEPVVGSRDLFGYRNVAKLAVRSARSRTLRAGVYEPGSHRLADAGGCAAQHPAINEVIAAVLEEASDVGLTAFDEDRGEGDLRYVVARYSHWRRHVLLVLVTGQQAIPRLRDLVRRLKRRRLPLGGIVQNVNGERGNAILGDSWIPLRAPIRLAERLGFLKLEMSPGSFLQVNLWTARRVYEAVIEALAPQAGDRVLDVFSGVGPLAFYLAAAAREVHGVESVAAAVRDARSNARRNGIHNTRFHEGPAGEVLPRLRETLGSIDLATVNPPRKGVEAAVLHELALLRPRRIVYVSCDPQTLARDLARLLELGYPPVRAQPFDMMPQTDHVETVVSCDRG